MPSEFCWFSFSFPVPAGTALPPLSCYSPSAVRVSCSPPASAPLLLFSCSVHLPPLPHLWSMPESIAAPRLAIVVVGSFPCTRCPSAHIPCTRTRWKLWGVWACSREGLTGKVFSLICNKVNQNTGKIPFYFYRPPCAMHLYYRVSASRVY